MRTATSGAALTNADVTERHPETVRNAKPGEEVGGKEVFAGALMYQALGANDLVGGEERFGKWEATEELIAFNCYGKSRALPGRRHGPRARCWLVIQLGECGGLRRHTIATALIGVGQSKVLGYGWKGQRCVVGLAQRTLRPFSSFVSVLCNE